MNRTILALLILSILPLSANAREGEDWDTSDPDLASWFAESVVKVLL